MLRTLALAALLVFVFAPGALADGNFVMSTSEGGPGTTSAGSPVRYVTITTNRNTVLESIRKRDGAVVSYRPLGGFWGIPAITPTLGGGLSHAGRTLVLGDASAPNGPLRRTTRLLVLGTKYFGVHQRLLLHGDFAFDALSPDGRTLFLIQHVSASDLNRYRVRAYDLRARRLLPGVIADRTQPGWTMSGYAVARASSPDGRWVYTLYRQAANYPFVHALDTVTRRAVCVAVPENWHATQYVNGALRLDGGRLSIADRPGGATRFVVDTHTFQVAAAARPDGPPLALAGVGAAAVFAAGVLLLVRRRRGTEAGRPV